MRSRKDFAACMCCNYRNGNHQVQARFPRLTRYVQEQIRHQWFAILRDAQRVADVRRKDGDFWASDNRHENGIFASLSYIAATNTTSEYVNLSCENLRISFIHQPRHWMHSHFEIRNSILTRPIFIQMWKISRMGVNYAGRPTTPVTVCAVRSDLLDPSVAEGGKHFTFDTFYCGMEFRNVRILCLLCVEALAVLPVCLLCVQAC